MPNSNKRLSIIWAVVGFIAMLGSLLIGAFIATILH